ncbi:hypothetical protein BDN70DRAFT_881982 [Pholiota conissans]|uniref:Adenylate kinase n=1 Tax=Pholiota conissans TaxID=109636 RepID=A0A9P5YY39_9AGAR|nr:hypothetical protein BDN70DRAFT_881982 [Pholiota conissans]
MSSLPPLLGDGHGRYRVQILGNSGSGKSTTGRALAELLGLPYISMDRLYWNPGWAQSSREEFEAKLRHALAQDPRGWVVDGNYASSGGIFVGEATTDIIWLDPPLYVYFPRIAWRTLLRLLRLGPSCSPGCDERFTEVFFSKDSILWWCLSQHWIVRRRNEERMKLIGLNSGSDVSNRRMRRFGGWGSDVKAWLNDVAAMVSAKKTS